jgi:hypothetical protein
MRNNVSLSFSGLRAWASVKKFFSKEGRLPPAVLRRMVGALALALIAGFVAAPVVHGAPAMVYPARMSPSDTRLLETIEHAGVQYFLEQTDSATGLVRDRAPNHLAPATAPASLAATGFGLSAWCVADARGWLAPGEAARRVHTTLAFAADRLEHVHGWFFHFVDPATGAHVRGSEVSTIDTALFLQGALLAREYLGDEQTRELVDRIYRRIDWRWAQDGGLTLTLGWKPRTGFIPYRWDSYSELMGMYLLGLGAPANPLPAESWEAWRRPRATIAGRTFISCPPLFTHQYAHAWFDFRGRRDAHADYWQNSVDATLAQRDWCAAQSHRYAHWSHTLWGLTASDGPNGYRAWGTPQTAADDESDGTLVPCAPAGSLPFAPDECLEALHAMRAFDGGRAWGRYGFADAFNPETGWVANDVIGIDVGITIVMTENLRSGLVWRCFMRAPEVQRGMQVAGFHREPTRDVRVVAVKDPTRWTAGG